MTRRFSIWLFAFFSSITVFGDLHDDFLPDLLEEIEVVLYHRQTIGV